MFVELLVKKVSKMKITSKLRYSLFLMGELALNYDKKLVQIKGFSQKSGLSLKYLEQIVILLKKKGLIQAVRGAYGGYKLVQPPEKISLYSILEASQGTITMGKNCVDQHQNSFCVHQSSCLNFALWELLDSSIKQKMENTSLKEFVLKNNKYWQYLCLG